MSGGHERVRSAAGASGEPDGRAVPLVAAGSYCRLDWQLRAEKPASVSLKVIARLKGLKGFLNGGGVMCKVINDQDSVGLSQNILSPLDPLEGEQGFLKLLPTQTNKRSDSHCRQGVPEIVTARESREDFFLGA